MTRRGFPACNLTETCASVGSVADSSRPQFPPAFGRTPPPAGFLPPMPQPARTPARTPSRKPTAHTDPVAYANRPEGKDFDCYEAVHAHVRKLIAGKPDEKKSCE